MSKTKRCIDCPVGVEHWTDEICGACGRCQLHCQEFVSSFSKDAKEGNTERLHELAGQTFLFAWNQMPEDPDRALIPLQPGPHSESSGLQPGNQLAVFPRTLGTRLRENSVQGDDDGSPGNSVQRVGQRGAAKPRAKRGNRGRDAE